jgi:alkylation response protein AidB-like acyl-CoA dehydrogenase
MSVNNSLVAGLEKYCNEEQKMKYLVPLAKGEVIGAFVYQSQRQVQMLLLKKTTAMIKETTIC